MAKKLILGFTVFIAVLHVCQSSLPAFQKKLNKNDICHEKICKFTLTLRDELSMTRRIRPGRIWEPGETFLLQLQDGKLIQKLGTFYQQPIYRDLENLEVNVTDEEITADGVQRALITINDVFPGPTLEVMEGSEVNIYIYIIKLYKKRALQHNPHVIQRLSHHTIILITLFARNITILLHITIIQLLPVSGEFVRRSG